MNLVFPALQTRFDSDATLSAFDLGRKLYLGLGGLKKTLPYVSVARVGGDTIGSMGETTGVDLEDYDLVFNGFTNQSDSSKVYDLMDALHNSLDKSGGWGYPDFTVIWMNRDSTVGPLIVDGVYQFTSTYSLRIERTTNLPVIRGE